MIIKQPTQPKIIMTEKEIKMIQQQLEEEANAMWSKGEATSDEASCGKHFINKFAELIKKIL